jgi:polar amino acid transport system substrate-binding protein
MTPERNMQFAFIGPYFVSGKAVLTKSQTLAQVQDAENFDQENLTLVALAGSTSEQFVKDVLPKARLTTVDDYDIAVQMVRDDKVQAMVADRPICVISVLRHPNSGLTTTARPLTLEPIGVAVPPDDPLFVNFMTNLFGAIEVTGGFELLTEKWFENSGWLAAMP